MLNIIIGVWLLCEHTVTENTAQKGKRIVYRKVNLLRGKTGIIDEKRGDVTQPGEARVSLSVTVVNSLRQPCAV
jgi:hypothetical protein